MKQTTYIHT